MLTFHKTLSQCEQGRREAWQQFLSDYTPVFFSILGVYVPHLDEQWRNQTWRESLGALTGNNFAQLRRFDHQSEREFLVGLRAFVLEKVSGTLDAATDSSAPPPALATLNNLLKGLPLIHQEILFLKLAGYSDGTLEGLLRITPSVAEKGLERLQANFSISLAREQNACLWPAAWLGLLRQASAAKTEDCAPLRQFVRILDGQTGWYDKEPVERHVAGCLHCLERWAALREIVHWRREAKRPPVGETNAFLGGLPIQPESKPEKSFLKRMFG